MQATDLCAGRPYSHDQLTRKKNTHKNRRQERRRNCRLSGDMLRKWIQFPPRFLSHILQTDDDVVDDDDISGQSNLKSK